MAKQTVDDYVEQIFPIQCKGRDKNDEEVLEEPVNVDVRIYKSPGSSMICCDVSNCQYNTGAHGERCKASHPDKDKVEEGIACPYSFDLPFSL